MDRLNEQLIEQNKQLLDLVKELTDRLELARTCRDKAKCVLCTSDEDCELHKQIDSLSNKAANRRVREMEAQVETLTEALGKMTAKASLQEAELLDLRPRYTGIVVELPEIIRRAKEEALAEHTDMVRRDGEHSEFMARLAERLGVKSDIHLSRLQSMVYDAVRKLQDR